MDYDSIVRKMRAKNDNKNICIQETNLLRKCILCRYLLSSNQWAPLLENYIKDKFNIQKPVNNVSGDGCIGNKNVEIKVSLGTQDGEISFVQLRPSHDIQYYIFLVYDLFDGDLGKNYWFLCRSLELYKLIPEYGKYSHGTISKNGEITINSIATPGLEYSLRMNTIKSGKSNKLWQHMLATFSKTEKEIYDILNNI